MSTVLLFGDQTAEQYSLLHKVVLHKENVLLRNFVERCSVALREECRLLSRSQRDMIPDFLSVNDLKEAYYQKGSKVAMVESALLVIAQLGHYIGYFSEHPAEFPAAANTRVLGLCTGLLSGAAVVSVKTVEELIPLGVEFVRLAFRSGAVVDGTRSILANVGDEKAPWSTIVTGTSEKDAREALSKFHQEKGIPQSNQAYISAVSVMAVTITGPPATTKRLFEESPLSQSHRVPIPVYAPYHAEHLYSDADFDRIFQGQISEGLMQATRLIAWLPPHPFWLAA